MTARRRPPADDTLDDEDPGAVFRAAIGPVRELPPTAAPPSAPKPRPRARMAERDELEARSEFRRALDAPLLETGDALRYRRDEVPARVLQRLARGLYAAQDEVDLHNLEASKAELLLREFIRASLEAGFGCIRIVHGKGLHSDSQVPVLKNMVDRLLRQRAAVLAFHSAPATQGGVGAVLVLLRKPK